MATDPPPFIPPRRRVFILSVMAAGIAMTIFPAFRRFEPLGQALIDTTIPVIVVLGLVGVARLIEKVFSGRARLWARIVEVSLALGLLVLIVALAGGGAGALMLAGSTWLVVTVALVVLAALRPDVTT